MPESVLGQNVSITISTINLKKKKKKYETTTLSIFPAQITGRMTCNQIEPNWWSPKSPFPVVFFFFFPISLHRKTVSYFESWHFHHPSKKQTKPRSGHSCPDLGLKMCFIFLSFSFLSTIKALGDIRIYRLYVTNLWHKSHVTYFFFCFVSLSPSDKYHLVSKFPNPVWFRSKNEPKTFRICIS